MAPKVKGGKGGRPQGKAGRQGLQKVPKGKKGEDETKPFWGSLDKFEHEREKLGFDDDEQEAGPESDQEEAVFNLNVGDSEDEESEDLDDDDEAAEEEEQMQRILKNLKVRKAFVDEDGILGEGKKEKVVSDKAWGKHKSSYYQSEVADEDEELKGEEEEAKRLQKEKYSSMHDEDFGEDLEDSFKTRLDKKKPKKEKPVKEKKESKLVPKEEISAEKIQKDLSSLSKEELTEIVTNESPELIQLLSEFKEKIADVKGNLTPLLEKVSKGELPKSKGISFLELKYHLMLSYCTNISFYLLLKASGEKVKEHPVIGHLVELRTALEKIKPLETKLQYQIQKLVSIANSGSISKDDPLRFKPNPANMMRDELEDEEEDEEKEEVYRPTKIAPVPYEEPKEKLKKQQERIRQKASRSRLLKDLQEEFSETPEEINYREELDEYDQKQKEKEAHEEDYFVRLPVTKAEKKKKKKSTFDDELANLGDFGDLAALEKTDETLGLPRRSSKGMDQVNSKEKKSILEALDEVNDNMEDDFDDSYYEEVKAANKKNKQQKKEEKKKAKEEEFEAFEDGNSEEEEEGKRSLTFEMMKNRGLTAKRKKEQKNPRVKKRMRFEQAQKKLRGSGLGGFVADKSAHYQGEMTGIKTNVSRSVRIK